MRSNIGTKEREWKVMYGACHNCRSRSRRLGDDTNGRILTTTSSDDASHDRFISIHFTCAHVCVHT